MEHLSLEIFDLPTAGNPNPTGSKFANMSPDASITITDTSEVFASGDVWSLSFTLNIPANAHIFGSSGELHGARLHEQVNRRRARLLVDGVPLYLGYLKLDDQAEVDAEGNVDLGFESGQKTFEERIEGVIATEVSVGDVPIGIALNRKRVVEIRRLYCEWRMDGLDPYAATKPLVKNAAKATMQREIAASKSPYVQRWPKLVKSHGIVFDSEGNRTGDAVDSDGLPIVDFTNVQTPYDAGHPFCNINICYPFKANDKGEEKAGRGYTMRLGHGLPTVDGGDHQTRFNNAPNFYLLYWLDRLFKDMDIHIIENQCLDVEDLRRVFLLNYGCHYEEIENDNDYYHSNSHTTPDDKQDGTPMLSRYGQYYLPFVSDDNEKRLLEDWDDAAKLIRQEDVPGKVLMRDLNIKFLTVNILSEGSVEGTMTKAQKASHAPSVPLFLATNAIESNKNAYSSYMAYATGDNYPNVEIGEIVDAMKSMFGVRLLFSNDYSTVRIVLLRNIFRSNEVQTIDCEIVDDDEKVENSIRGFRMTYGKGTDSTSFYYKGFADLFPRASQTWRDTSDKHDYSQWNTDAKYDEIKQNVSAFNRMCYITPSTGNSYGTQVDEDEDVLFPSLLEWAGFMDAEDGDCSGEKETIDEVQCGATPVIMNTVGTSYASLFSGDLKAPSPSDFKYAQEIATFGRSEKTSVDFGWSDGGYTLTSKLDLYVSEGFKIRMEDNYAISNGGTPFDEADPGLCFGIMRSSGEDASVSYYDDGDDEEGNDAWTVQPGKSPVSHPDTCNNHGQLWDYDGQRKVSTAEDAEAELPVQFPDSNAAFNDANDGFIALAMTRYVYDDEQKRHTVLFMAKRSRAVAVRDIPKYANSMRGLSAAEMLAKDASERNLIVEIDSSIERGKTLAQLCGMAYGGQTGTIVIDKYGVGSDYGRFSLKLRGEKLNPYYEAGSDDPAKKDRYLAIDNENLRGRGLCDQFYKEYSYWVRNARIVKRTVRMELAQLLSIDKTKRVTVGDITGFIRKMQYTISNDNGLGNVEMEIMYI